MIIGNIPHPMTMALLYSNKMLQKESILKDKQPEGGKIEFGPLCWMRWRTGERAFLIKVQPEEGKGAGMQGCG